MAGELVKVPFHGDELDAIQDDGGKVWVSLRRCCENLGLDVKNQLVKLKAKEWATMVENTMVAEDGKQRSVTCIDLDTLPMWLGSIETRKVKPIIREKIVRYQRECAKVLADHFFGRRKASSSAQQLTIEHVTAVVQQVLTQLLPSLVQPLVAQIHLPAANRERDLTPIHQLETVASRLARLLPHWSTTREHRKRISAIARRNVKDALSQEPLWGNNGGCLQFLPHMHFHLDTAIWQVYREACRDNEVEDFGLFAEHMTA